jgi:hypothetical protein
MRETMFRRSLGLGLAAGFSAATLAMRPAVAQEPHEQPHHHAQGMPTTTDVGGAVPLYDDLEAQKKTAEAGKVDAQYRKIWDKADVKPLAVGM